MTFASPQAFALLLLLPLDGFWQLRQRKQHTGLPISSLSLFAGIKTGLPWFFYLSKLCFALFFICLVFSLARLQSGQETITTTAKGVDIMLALDTSVSMRAEDFSPNRLTAAKRVITEFVGQQTGNRLGVVVFAGESYTLMPLSTDYQVIIDAVNEIYENIVHAGGTAIGDAIGNALNRFDDKNKGSRVIVLLTDGQNEGGLIEPLEAAKIADQQGVRIHVIGMGKPEGAPVPLLDAYGNHRIDPRTGRRAYARDRWGNLLFTQINETELKAIAKLTGGLYFRAGNDNSLNAIYQQINQMEKTEFETQKRTVYSEQMHWFLIPALLFFVLAIILRQGKGQILHLEREV